MKLATIISTISLMVSTVVAVPMPDLPDLNHIRPSANNAQPGGAIPQTDNQVANILSSPLDSTTGQLAKPNGVDKILSQVVSGL